MSPAFSDSLRSIGTDTITYDPLGNITGGVNRDSMRAVTTGGTAIVKSRRTRNVTYRANIGRDTVDNLGTASRFLRYDAAGNNAFTTLQPSGNGPREDRASYYDATGKLMAADWMWAEQVSDQTPWKRVFEEYRYDALGRRIWVRAQRNCFEVKNDGLPNYSPGQLAIECQVSFIRRTVWDGDQELVEINAPGDSTQTAMFEQDTGYYDVGALLSQDRDPYYGRVVYTYGLTLDQPLSVARFGYADHPSGGSFTTWPAMVIMPLWDTRGRPATGVFSDGGAVKQYSSGGGACATGNNTQRCALLYWPFSWSSYDQRTGIRPVSWFGTLLEDKRDYAGTSYRRNRVYDPATGRFTQEDPIGLAGGLNLYGFADGDPVNFSDPFGLCPLERTGEPCTGGSASASMAIFSTLASMPIGEAILQSGMFGLSSAVGGELTVGVATAAGRVLGAVSKGRTLLGRDAVMMGNEVEARLAGRLFTGPGSRVIRATRGTGDEIGRISADATRVYRSPQMKYSGPNAGMRAANLVRRGSRGEELSNLHLIIPP